jgi:hypothetical protein
MQYPSELPQDAQARVEAERIRAYLALEQDVSGTKSWRRDNQFIRCVARIFIAFAREVCAFARKQNHPDWSGGELDLRCREFLLSVAIEAWEEKAKDIGIEPIHWSPNHWGYSLRDDARRKIERSPEWSEYQALLLDILKSQSVQQAEEVVGTAPRRRPWAPSADEIKRAEKPAARRRAVVNPILERKRWTRSQLVKEAGVGKATVYNYLDGTRASISKENRKAIADALEIKLEQLPD